MNHALAVSALIGSILDNDHVACLKDYAPTVTCMVTNVPGLICQVYGEVVR